MPREEKRLAQGHSGCDWLKQLTLPQGPDKHLWTLSWGGPNSGKEERDLASQLARKGAPPQNLLPSSTPLFLPFPSLHLQVSSWVVMSSSTCFQILCPVTHLWTTCAFHHHQRVC